MKKFASRVTMITFILTILLTTAQVSIAKEKVSIAQFNWPGSIIVVEIMKNILENKIGAQVDIKKLSPAIAFPAIDKGSIDIFSDLWWPNLQEGINKYVNEKKSVELVLSYAPCQQGFIIPTWVSEKYGIKTVADLNKHTKLFDTDGNGKGNIWVGAAGGIVSEVNRVKLRDYNLELDGYSTAPYVFQAQLKEFMRKKKPIVFYYWSPSWIWSTYDLTIIKEPDHDPAKWNFIEKDFKNSSVTCEFIPAKAYVGISTKLKEKSPESYKFFKNWSMTVEDMSFLITELSEAPDNPKQDPADVAAKWIKDNPERVAGWLK